MGRCAIRKVGEDTIRVGMRTATGDYHSLLFDADQLRDLYESLHEFVLGTSPNKQSTPCSHCNKFPSGETTLGWKWCPWCGRKL